MKALDRRVAEAQTPEQLQNIAKEGQKLGLDIKFTELKPTLSSHIVPGAFFFFCSLAIIIKLCK